ncbi:MAG TPA: ABC transporter substrate binding protein [Pyrinomonadaceae bacterium]|nr:ABC transporter substrate binding protein [Pyrinomonadaceae bacterium]
MIALSTTTSAAEKKILFLYGDKSNGVMITYREFLQSALKAGTSDQLTFYEEYMDLSQYPGDDYVLLIRNFYRQKYQGQRFDLIFSQAPSVLNFLSKYGEELFPGTPTVFGTLDQSRLKEIKLGPNITGVLTRNEMGKTLDAALRMQPDVRHVIVVSGTSPIDAKYLAIARSEFQSFEGRVQFTYLNDLPIQALEKRLSELPEHTIIFYVTLFRDGAGQSFSLIESVARVAKAASVPTYSFVDRFLAVGSIGGFVFDNEGDAKEVAKVALRVLAGEKPADIPIYVGNTYRYMFNWRELERWRIDQQRLPPNSVILFRVPTFWEAYKWRIVAVTMVFLLLALLIIWLLINRKRIQRSQQAVQHLSGRLLMLQDEERKRVAAELHDGLGQSLAIIKNRAILGLRDRTDNQRARDQLEEIAATATASIAEVHEIAHNLRPYELDRLGLVAAIETMIQRVSASTTIKLSTDLEKIEGLLSREAETSVYRIVQEGLNNVIKHSKASAAGIEIKKIGGQLAIRVHDNGAGIPVVAVRDGNGYQGFGLVGIAERVRVLGGSLAVDSQPSRGTAINISLELANGVAK